MVNTLSDLIAEQPFFRDFDPRYLPELAASAELMRFGAHRPIFEKGDAADKFYLITSGEVSLTTHFVADVGIRGIQHLHAGEALGWSWLFPPHEWQFSANALSDVEAIVFDAAGLRAAMDRDHSLGYVLAMRVGFMLGDRLQSTRVSMLNPSR